jgi:hypothetical protein
MSRTATFTVLVTVALDDGQGVSASRIAEICQCALEEGTSQSGSFLSAQVDAFRGAHLDTRYVSGDDFDRHARIAPLHESNASRWPHPAR